MNVAYPILSTTHGLGKVFPKWPKDRYYNLSVLLGSPLQIDMTIHVALTTLDAKI
jgi:hypothetical protein